MKESETIEWNTAYDYKGGYGEMVSSKCGRYSKGFEYRSDCCHFFTIDHVKGTKEGGVTAEIIAASRIRG